MKSKTLARLMAVALFAPLAPTVRPVAQGQPVDEPHKRQHHRYRLIDIGTFGGPESNVNLAVNAGPILSRRGTSVGTSATSVPSSPESNFICGGLDGAVPFVFHSFRWQEGAVSDLASLPPAANNCSEAQAINEKGEIVLQSENGAIDPVTGIKEIRGVRWQNGKLEDLGTFGGNNSLANQINSRGQIAGAALNTIPDPFSIYYSLFLGSSNGTQTRAFLWENGHKEDLGTLGGPDALATYVNERGQVAGVSYTSATPSASGFPVMDPFLWTMEDGMIDLGSLGGTSGGPNALNNRGQVIGSSNLAGDQDSHPFLWDDGKLVDLFTGAVGGNPVSANAINDTGEIVGQAIFSNQFFHAYLWRNGAATDLGTLPGDCFSEAFAINSRGQVVGRSVACDSSTRSFLWEDGFMIDLNAFVPAGSRLQLVDTQAINDRGEIAGDLLPPSCTGNPQGRDDQCGHAFVLIPCDEAHDDDKGCKDDSQGSAGVLQSLPAQIPETSIRSEALTPRERALRMLTHVGGNRGLGAVPK